MVNNLALFIVSVLGIIVLDDDPTAVSAQEWIFFGVMVYSAISLIRLARQFFED